MIKVEKLNYSDIKDLMYAVKQKINAFENRNLQHRLIRLRLADGKFICIKIPQRHLPHMLGFHLEYVSNSLIKGRSGYDLLKDWCNDPYEFHRQIARGEIQPKVISSYINEKLDAFLENCFTNKDSEEIQKIEWVLEFDKTRNYADLLVKKTKTDDKEYDFDIAIAKKDENGKVYLLKLVKADSYDAEGNVYYPYSSMMFENEEEFRKATDKLLKKQALTLPVTINTAAYGKPKALYTPYKLEKTRKLVEISRETGADLVVGTDFIHALEKYAESKEDLSVLSDFAFDKITTQMNGCKKVNPSDIGVRSFGDMNPKLAEMLRAYNNVINMVNTLSKGSDKDELIKLRERLLFLNEKISTLNTTIDDLNDKIAELNGVNAGLATENESLKEEVGSYKDTLNGIVNSAQKVLK